jgi:hypothetical protein
MVGFERATGCEILVPRQTSTWVSKNTHQQNVKPSGTGIWRKWTLGTAATAGPRPEHGNQPKESLRDFEAPKAAIILALRG